MYHRKLYDRKEFPLKKKEVFKMKKYSQLLYLSVVLFASVTVLFLLFFLYVDHHEKTNIYQARESRSYAPIETYTRKRIADGTAPAGVRNVYRWTQQVQTKNDTCLTILTVHQSIQVYFGDELIYSMEPSEENLVAGSPGTYWSTIPLYPSDDGTDITVIVTPLFSSVIDYGAEFWCGSQFSTLFGQLSQEIPQMFTAAMCMVLGAFIILVQLYFFFTTHTQAWDMFFLGSFAILLGLWRLTYGYSISILFPDSAMALGYITIGSLFLISIPMAMFSGAFVKNNKLLLIASCASSLVTVLVLLLQVLGIMELREMLIVSHIMLIATICVVFASMWQQRKCEKQQKNSKNPFFMIVIGILLDLISFTLDTTSSEVMFTLLAFILYALIVFISHATNISHNASTDSRTGLANRLRWNELMQDDAKIPEPFAILLIDLNGLKKVNDTFGHEAGDRMIFHFANILRNSLPGSGVICRWGGDEFSVLLTGVSRSQLDDHIHALHCATEEYNTANPDLPIHFAIGAALSTEHPSMTRAKLFQLADEEMYRNKQLWYKQKQTNS